MQNLHFAASSLLFNLRNSFAFKWFHFTSSPGIVYGHNEDSSPAAAVALVHLANFDLQTMLHCLSLSLSLFPGAGTWSHVTLGTGTAHGQSERGVSNSQAAVADNAALAMKWVFPVLPLAFLFGWKLMPLTISVAIAYSLSGPTVSECSVNTRWVPYRQSPLVSPCLHSAQRFHLLISLIKAAPTVLPIDCRGELNWSNDEANVSVCLCVCVTVRA